MRAVRRQPEAAREGRGRRRLRAADVGATCEYQLGGVVERGKPKLSSKLGGPMSPSCRLPRIAPPLMPHRSSPRGLRLHLQRIG